MLGSGKLIYFTLLNLVFYLDFRLSLVREEFQKEVNRGAGGIYSFVFCFLPGNCIWNLNFHSENANVIGSRNC